MFFCTYTIWTVRYLVTSSTTKYNLELKKGQFLKTSPLPL